MIVLVHLFVFLLVSSVCAVCALVCAWACVCVCAFVCTCVCGTACALLVLLGVPRSVLLCVL